MNKKIINIIAIMTVITGTVLLNSFSSSASITARHEQTPEQAMHAFDGKPDNLGWYDSMKWNEAHDMYCFIGVNDLSCCWDGVGYGLSDISFVYYATPNEPTCEYGTNILLEPLKKGIIPICDKGVIVDPNHRTAKSKVDPNYIPQSEFVNQIVLDNVVSKMNKNVTLAYDSRFDAYYCDSRKVNQSIPCFEITASKPCLIEIRQNSVRTDGEVLLPNTVLFCPTDLNKCVSIHSENKFHTAPGKGEKLGWDLIIDTNDFYREEPIDYNQTHFNLDMPEENAAGMAKLGLATTHFMLAEGKNYIYYNSYCDTINNFIISTDDGSASIKLDCVTRYDSTMKNW